jgi:hypothetical protein
MIFSSESKGEEPQLPFHLQLQYVFAGLPESYQLIKPALVRGEHPSLDILRVFWYTAVHPNVDSTTGLFRLNNQENIFGMKSQLKNSILLRCDVFPTDNPFS